MANDRWFYEAMPLGNRAAITFLEASQRGTRGFFPASRSVFTAPLIGTYGWSNQLNLTAQVIAESGDFLDQLELMTATRAYLRATTKEIEDLWLLQHNVLARRLGTVGYVTDITVYGEATGFSVQTGAGIAFGTLRITMANDATFVALVEVNDRVVISRDPDQGIASVGEIGTVTAKGANWVEVISRTTTATGTTPYEGHTDLVVYIAQAFYEGYVFRSDAVGASRTLGEAGAPSGGTRFTFEGFGDFQRRDNVIGLTLTPTPAVLWGEAGYGSNKYGGPL